ncbi:hypothetical protein K3495_g9943 [Podosphaera aphanis]|nr:hypothetical protein K3495_g9943 [Podosphaera aphanis]
MSTKQGTLHTNDYRIYAANTSDSSAIELPLQSLSHAECNNLLKSMNIQPDALLGSAPPPRNGFVSYIGTEGVLNHVQEHANKNGYAVSTAAGSKANRKFIRCDKGGNPDNKGKNPSSKKNGCPFSLLATQGKDGLWSVKVEIDHHNHPADTDEAASPLNRIKRLMKNELQDIHDGFENSDQPKSILSITTITPKLP